MLSVVMLNVVMLNVVVLIVITLNAIMLSVITLSVVAPLFVPTLLLWPCFDFVNAKCQFVCKGLHFWIAQITSFGRLGIEQQ
jgi:hypothetical protein